MPPQPSSSSLKEQRLGKKMGIMQKPKGAVRAKSGCYTCRIRRKKCDEKRIGGYEEGPCETCSRLKLECLGFGAKRPEWLRENSRVSAIRDRIKAHLAAQGMIKGHAGSGSRPTVHEEFLRLSDPRDDDMTYRTGGSSDSTDGSPNLRGQSVDSENPYGAPPRLSLATSAMRGGYDYRGYDYTMHSDMHSRSHSPAAASSMYDDQAAEYPLVQYRQHPFETHTPATLAHTPATRSSFSIGGHYHALYIIDEEPEFVWSFDSVNHFYPSTQVGPELINSCMRDYVSNVVRIQYLLGDRNMLPNMIWDSIQSHPESHEAVNLLARAYYGRQSNAHFSVLQSSEFQMTITNLQVSLNKKHYFTADDAMAALHVISLYLFDGGQGPWNEFLAFASAYVHTVLTNPAARGPVDALEHASAKDQFVVKTTIWFDVLASITLRKPPVLLGYIRALFDPAADFFGAPRTYSMLSPMGCENAVVWALAETAALACWKADREAAGGLSVRELVGRAARIDQHLQAPQRPVAAPDADTCARAAAAEIFRTSARLFLRSVESGAQPHVADVQECVQETFDAITGIRAAALAAAPPQTRSAVVRSTVFGIFICGSLEDDPARRRILQLQLEQNAGQEGVGNCTAVSRLLEDMWYERDSRPRHEPVPWRERLEKAQILLV